MNDRLRGRLENWKFGSAEQYLDGEPEHVKNGVKALARVFSNCGWIDGDMGVIIALAVDTVLCERIVPKEESVT